MSAHTWVYNIAHRFHAKPAFLFEHAHVPTTMADFFAMQWYKILSYTSWDMAGPQNDSKRRRIRWQSVKPSLSFKTQCLESCYD